MGDVTPILQQTRDIVSAAVEGVTVLAGMPSKIVLQNVSTGVILDVMDIVNLVVPVVKVCVFFFSPDGSP